MFLAQLPPTFFSFLKIPASLALLNSDLHLLKLFSAWAPHLCIVSREYLEVKSWSNYGVYFTCFHSLKDHSPALPMLL